MYVIFERDVWVLKMILEHNIYQDKLKRKRSRLTLRTCRLGNVWKYTSLRYLSYSMTKEVHILEYSFQISREEKKRKVEKCSWHSEWLFELPNQTNDQGHVDQQLSRVKSIYSGNSGARSLTSGKMEEYTSFDI